MVGLSKKLQCKLELADYVPLTTSNKIATRLIISVYSQ